jgi:hypothetical protein
MRQLVKIYTANGIDKLFFHRLGKPFQIAFFKEDQCLESVLRVKLRPVNDLGAGQGERQIDAAFGQDRGDIDIIFRLCPSLHDGGFCSARSSRDATFKPVIGTLPISPTRCSRGTPKKETFTAPRLCTVTLKVLEDEPVLNLPICWTISIVNVDVRLWNSTLR